MTKPHHPPCRPPARWRLPWLAAPAVATLVACSPPAPQAWSGYVEGDFIYLAAPVAGTLRELAVTRGQTVAAGSTLFRLDDVPNRAARQEADARWQAAQAQADNGSTGRRQAELAVSRAQRAQAMAVAERADAELLRQQALLAQNFISRSRLDDAATAATQARARVAELDAALQVAGSALSRPAELQAARASAEAAHQAQAQAAWREQQAVQTAPATALVADTFFQPGEYVGAGQPVLALLPPGQRKARFYVPQAELARVAVGQAVQLSCDGCGAPLAATVRFVAAQAEYTPPVIYSNAQRARLVFLVEATPDTAADALRLQPGQPVDVRPATGRAAP